MSVADRTGTSASSTRSGRIPGTSGRVSASDTSLPLGNASLNGRPQRPVLRPRISRVVSPAAPSGDSSLPVEQVARSARKELTEGWVLFVGALVALVAVREGLRRLGRTPARSRSGPCPRRMQWAQSLSSRKDCIASGPGR